MLFPLLQFVADLKTFDGVLSESGGKLTILHKLNQKAGKWNLDVEQFRPNLKDWEKVPVIFAKKHPTTRAMVDLKGALESCDGKLMGFPSNVRIETSGHAKLLGEIPINDAVAESYYKKGVLTPSTGWDSPDDGVSKITGAVVPDHILLFPEDDAHKAGDPAAMMFQEPIPTYMAEFKQYMEKIWARITKDDKKEGTEMGDAELKAYQAEQEKKIADMLKTFEAEKLALTKSLEEKEKALKEHQMKLEQEKRDLAWKEFQTAFTVPKAWMTGKVKAGDKEIDRSEQTRKEFEADPAAFAVKVKKFEDQNGGAGGDTSGKDTGGDAGGSGGAGREYPPVKTIGSNSEWDEATGKYK